MSFAVLGGAVGYLLARHGAAFLPTGVSRGEKLIVVAISPLIWLAVVAWHEFGHVIGGWLVGGRFLLYIVGPFKWQRTPAGVRFTWNRSVNLGGGLAACLPLDDRDLPRRMAAMTAAGPLASIGLVVLALWGAVGADAIGWAWLQHVSLVTAVISGLIFLVTVWPAEMGGFKSDGKRVWELARGGPRSMQEAALLALTVAGLAGVRPADLEPEKITAAIGADDSSLNTLYGHLNAYMHSADLGEWPRAQAHLDCLVEREGLVPPFVRAMVRAEYAWLLAQSPGAAAAARAWLETAGPVDFDPATRLRAEAAVLLTEGKANEAVAKAREGLTALETKSLSPVKSAFAADALETILLRAVAAGGTPSR